MTSVFFPTAERAEYDAILARFNSPDSHGKQRIDIDKDKFVIKCVAQQNRFRRRMFDNP